MIYCNDPKFLDGQVKANNVDPVFAILSASFWMHFSLIKPKCSTLRIITANFSGVRIFSFLAHLSRGPTR